MATKADNLRQTGMDDKSRKYLRESGTTRRYERGFGAPDVCNGVGSHWVENINWMRVTSDLDIKTAGQIRLQGD